MILHYAKVFIAMDNILWHKAGPSDHTGSHENLPQGCKIDLIAHSKPCNGYSFPLVVPQFSTFY